MAGTAGILLDVTRTVSRAGAGAPTGVDRVERAYIEWALGRDTRAIFLARAFTSYVLLDERGMAAFLASDPLDRPDLLSRAALKQSDGQRRAESTLRRLALDKVPRARLSSLLSRHAAPGFHALNVGHANQTSRVYGAYREAGAGLVATLVHDVIPLDYPEYTRPGAVERFRGQLRVMAEGSDLLIYNSAYTAERSNHWLEGMGLSREGFVAHLGTDPSPTLTAIPTEVPEFLALGTIEPRKNHLLLLTIWRRFHDTLPPDRIPHLHIVGRRGWENEMVVDMLDRAPFMGRTVHEHGFLDDAALATRVARARALLFPSFAEGFGLPLVEGLAAGLPVLCSDIPPFRELGGAAATYLDPLDGLGWHSAILDLSNRDVSGTVARREPVVLPDWPAHFRRVEQALSAQTKAEKTDIEHE